MTAATEDVRQRISELGDWFHNMTLCGIPTAPHHFLGDYPACKWKHIQTAIPNDLRGKTVLDIGCNAGFYSIEMKRRGASRVLGIDSDMRYLRQAKLAAHLSEIDIEFRQLDVYQIADLKEKFDLVLFMGVLYHLRHPLLALDLLHQHVVGDTLIFQSLMRGSQSIAPVADNYPFSNSEVFQEEGYPMLYFVEHSYASDPTNWWIPNRACVEAMLRSAGFSIQLRPEDEVYICARNEAHG